VKRAFDNGLKEPARPRGGRAKAPPPPEEVELIESIISSVQMKPVNWLWPDRIARGKLSMLAGHPDLGKSLLTLDLAARVSRGDPWPLNGSHAPLGWVVILSAEDDPEDTYGPRLKALGADLDIISAITMVKVKSEGKTSYRGFDLQRDIERLEEIVDRRQANFVIIDPVSAYMGAPGKIDTHRNTDVRGVLAPLASMAQRTQAAVLLVSHLTKSGGNEALQRVTGSGAFIAAVRAGFMVERDEADGAPPGRRLVLPIKNNLSPVRTGFAYRIGQRDVEGIGGLPVIEWEDELVEMTADQALAAKDREQRRPDSPVVNFLRELLSDGPRLMKDAEEAAIGRGYSAKQLRSAREKIGIIPYKEGFDGRWWWKLPDGPVPF
jgi:hypothetical protein